MWSAIANGVISVPITGVMMWIGQSAGVMGALTISGRQGDFGSSATALMALAVAVMFATA